MKFFSITALLLFVLLASASTEAIQADERSCFLFPPIFRSLSRSEPKPAENLAMAPPYVPAPATMVVERPVHTTRYSAAYSSPMSIAPVTVEYSLPMQSGPPISESVRYYDQPIASTSNRLVTTVIEPVPLETRIVERHILPYEGSVTTRRIVTEPPAPERQTTYRVDDSELRPLGETEKIETKPLSETVKNDSPARREETPSALSGERHTNRRPPEIPTILETSDHEEGLADSDEGGVTPMPQWPDFPTSSPIVLNRPASRSGETPAPKPAAPRETPPVRNDEGAAPVFRAQSSEIGDSLDRALGVPMALPPPKGLTNPKDIPEVLVKTENPLGPLDDFTEGPEPDSTTNSNATTVPGATKNPADASTSKSSPNTLLLVATIISTVGCVFFVVLAFDYYQRWMQSLTTQNDRYALGEGGNIQDYSSDLDYYPAGGSYMDDLSRYGSDLYEPSPRY